MFFTFLKTCISLSLNDQSVMRLVAVPFALVSLYRTLCCYNTKTEHRKSGKMCVSQRVCSASAIRILAIPFQNNP